jgi:hypothetical protein
VISKPFLLENLREAIAKVTSAERRADTPGSTPRASGDCGPR